MIWSKWDKPQGIAEARARLAILEKDCRRIAEDVLEHKAAIEEGPPATEDEEDWLARAQSAFEFKLEEAEFLKAWIEGAEEKDRREREAEERRAKKERDKAARMEAQARLVEAQQAAKKAKKQRELACTADAALKRIEATAEAARLYREQKRAEAQRRHIEHQRTRVWEFSTDEDPSAAMVSAIRRIVGRACKEHGFELTEQESVAMNAAGSWLDLKSIEREQQRAGA